MTGKIQRKFFLWSSLIMITAGLFLSVVLYFHLKNLLTFEVKDKAHLVFAQVDAVQSYVRKVLRPTMYAILPRNKFVLQAMSTSYISRAVMERMNFHKDDYYYRRVAINARNPDFEPDELESSLIKYFRARPQLKLWEGYKKIGQDEYYVMARPVRFDKSCMYCHGRVSDAPREIVNIYGDKRGFGHHPGEIGGLDIVALPVQSVVMQIIGTSFSYALMVFAGGIFVLAVLNVSFKSLVVNDLRKILDIFKTYFNYDYKPRKLTEQRKIDDEIDEIIYATQGLAKYLKEVEEEEKRMLLKMQHSEKMIAVGRLAAGLAHEINNPLGVILCYAQILRSSLEDEQQLKDMDVIIKHTKMAQKVLTDLLNFARPKKAEKTKLPPEEVIAGLASVFKVQADTRQVKFTTRIDSPLPPIIADRAALEQVLTNLFLNSLDAVPPDKGHIELYVYADGNSNLVFGIRDNGPGIKDEDMDRIFDPFYTTKEPGQGTGLGLAVVYSLVQEMDGDIRVKNDGGAVFEILLKTTQ